MNPATRTKSASEMTLTESVMALLRHYLGGRKGLILLTVAVLGAGMYFNWGWLVAVGVAPLLLAIAPCAIMCGLGLCMNKMCSKSAPAQSKSGIQDGDESAPASAPGAKGRDEA